jgi:hypothetical protein
MLIRSRSEAAKAQRDKRLTDWFGTRRWRVCTEVSGERKDGRDTVVYDHGEFWIIGGGARSGRPTFQTPFGHNGVHGFVIQEVDGAGQDLGTEPVCFGHALLAKVHALYKCFPAGLPPERKRPPRSA